MLHPDTVLRIVDDRVGYGIFASRRIRRSTITWVLDPLDRLFEPPDIERLDPESRAVLDRYAWTNHAGAKILCWDLARYMNHSCEPASLGPGGLEFDIALRDIEAGEELTTDYGVLNLEQPLLCSCGSPRCRGAIGGSDFDSQTVAWDTSLRAAIANATEVPQPLLRWLGESDRRKLAGFARRPESTPSTCRHRRERAGP